MKRKIILKAEGSNSTAKVTIELTTGPEYMRHETTALALDIADDIAAALGKRYRPTNIACRALRSPT